MELEEAQRVKAREREAKGETWQPVFFHQVTGNGGQPELTEKGREVLRRAQQGNWDMTGILDGQTQEDGEDELEEVRGK
jgi:hypothetical protein